MQKEMRLNFLDSFRLEACPLGSLFAEIKRMLQSLCSIR